MECRLECFARLTVFVIMWRDVTLYVTGSPAARLSRVNGVRRSSAKTWNFNPLPKSQFDINWFEIGVGDYVREVTSHVKFGPDPMSGRDATWGQHIRVLWLLIFCLFFYSSTELQPIPVNQFSRTVAQKTRSGIRKTLFGMRSVVLWNLGVFHQKNTAKLGRKGQLPSEIKCRITSKR